MPGRNFTSNEAILNLDGDTAGVRKIIRMEAEDRDVAFLQFNNDSIYVDIEVVSYYQYCIGHCSPSITTSREQEQKLLVSAPAWYVSLAKDIIDSDVVYVDE